MPPRKKTRGTLKRSSSDSPGDDDAAVNSKRPRQDGPADTSSNISVDAATSANRARKPVVYKSKARAKAGLSDAAPPKLTSFGFNIENKPKTSRTLFHLSPSPRAKARAKTKVFGSPMANKRRSSKGKGTASADTSRVQVEADEEEEQDETDEPEPNNSFGTSPAPEEADDQPAPLPTLPAVRPISGPGLEIRTPLKDRIAPASLQSLSMRKPRTDSTPVPLFAATPRAPLFPLPTEDTNTLISPTKSHNIPTFAPIKSTVPSTPAQRPRSTSMFTPIVNRGQDAGQEHDGSPVKKPPPVFAPTPARRQQSEPPTDVFGSLRTPAHTNTLPVAPPKLPFTVSLPATEIPATPTAKGRNVPTFTPKMLFPPQKGEEAKPVEQEEKVTRGVRGTKVSKAPMFGALEEGEGEEPTPRVDKVAEPPLDTKAPEEQGEQGEQELRDEGEADVSMAELFDTSTGVLSPEVEKALTTGQGFFASVDQPGPIPQPAFANTLPVAAEVAAVRVTRSRSRSASASVAGPSASDERATTSRAGSQAPQSKAESVAPDSQPVASTSRAGSVAPASRASSVAPTPIAENPPAQTSRSTATTPRSLSISLPPLVTDPRSLTTLKSRTNSMDEHRASQTAVMMMDTPADEEPSAFPELERQTTEETESRDEMDPETSPLSSLPEDMSFDFLAVGDRVDDEMAGDITTGDTTMRDADDTIRDKSMQLREPPNPTASPPFSPPAPTSPVSSLPGDISMRESELFLSPRKRGLPDSSPTRPVSAEDVMVPLSDFPRAIPLADTRSRSSSLTSLSDLSDEDVPMDDKGKAPATEARKSMIPIAKRPTTPGPGTRPPTPGANGSKTPFKAGVNGVTPGPNRNGIVPAKNGLASVKSKVAPTPGAIRNGMPTPSGSKLPAPITASSSTTSLGMGKAPSARSTMATRTRSGAVKARSLAAPTASTAAKTRTKVVTAPPPSRSRITSFMKPRVPSSSGVMPPPSAPIAPISESPRKGQSKDDSDLRGPRRSMISQDTQASLSSLSSALERLARPSITGARTGAFPPRPGTSMGFIPRPGSSLGFSERGRVASASASGSENGNALSSSAGPGGSKPVIKSTRAATPTVPAPAAGKGKGKAKEGTDDAAYEEPSKPKPKDDPNAPLRSCVIFVDVRTAEGEDAGSLFVDMLRDLGAKIVSKPTRSTTHIVFKSGHQSTLTKYKLYDDPVPFLVGIGWVVQCVEKRARVDEEDFKVKTDQVSALDLKRRRKSQLPHQMQFMARDPNPNGPKFGSLSAEAAAVSKSLEASAAEVAQDAELAAERGKQRIQQKLFPRVRDRSPT